MSIYEQPVRVLMRNMADELAEEPRSLFSRKDAIAWFAERYPKIKSATVTAHLIRLSTNVVNRIHYSPNPGDDDVLFRIDPNHFRKYRPSSDPAPIYSRADIGGNGGDDGDGVENGSREFAYEKDLQHYLSKNLGALERGLQLYEDEGITGIEFPVGGRYIDILAVDRVGNLVVIELKVSRGYDRVVGQLLRYVAWIRNNLAEGDQEVRGLALPDFLWGRASG